MAADEPPYLTVGTDVSAKYKGAFCEAKIKKVNRVVKCKVTFKNNMGSFMVTDDQIKGSLRIGADIEAKHPEKNQFLEAVINKLQDYSQYTVVFDDGDETTLRRTSLCLKSGRHFAESPTLDQFPLTNPEHFGTPVIGAGKYKRKRRSTMNSSLDYESSDDDSMPRKLKAIRGKERDPDLGKVVCVDYGDRRKKDSWYPGLIVPHPAQSTIKITKEEHLIRSFKDGKYYQVPKRDTREFTRESIPKFDNNALRIAVEKALIYLEKEELPPHWDKALFMGLELPSADEDSHDSDSDSSDDEPSEEKDRFVAQLYKFMDERGTPINKAPTVSNRDLNLYKLFKIMHKLGGYNKVTNKNKWKAVYSKMGLPQSNLNGPNQMKLAYKRYLQSFEDFYRKLGCTMVTNSRSTRGRHRSDRNFIITRTRDRDTASPKGRNTKEMKEKTTTEKKVEEKPRGNEKKDIKAEDNSKTEEKPKSPEKKKLDRLRSDKEDKEEKRKKEEKPRIIRSQSVNKDKKDKESSPKEEEKKDPKPEKARTREDARKEKNESPEKKGTRSSLKMELERKEREEASKEKKERSPKEKEKKEEKQTKEIKEEKPKDKKEDKAIKERKIVKEKKVEEKPPKEKREVTVREKRDERVLKDKRDSSKEPKDEKIIKGKKEEVKNQIEEKSPVKKKLDRVVKEKKEEKVVRPRREDKSPSVDLSKKLIDDTDAKIIKEEKPPKNELEVKKEEPVAKDKPRPKLREKREGTPFSEEGEPIAETDISDEKDGPSQDGFEKRGPGSRSRDDIDEPPNRGKRKSLKGDDKDEKESLLGLSDSDDESFINCSEKAFSKDVKHGEIEIGDRVKVKYGRGRMQKVYDAKVLKIEMDGPDRRYYVHYAGWNTRYDEWVRKNYIVAHITASKQKLECNSKSPLPSTSMRKIDRGRPPGLFINMKPVRKNSTSSTNSSLSCPRATRSEKKNLQSSPLSSGLEPRKRTRKKSGIVVGLTDTSQESDSDVDPMDLDDEDMDDADVEDNTVAQIDCFKEELFSDDEEKEKLEDVKRGDITQLEKAISVEENGDDIKDSFFGPITQNDPDEKSFIKEESTNSCHIVEAHEKESCTSDIKTDKNNSEFDVKLENVGEKKTLESTSKLPVNKSETESEPFLSDMPVVSNISKKASDNIIKPSDITVPSTSETKENPFASVQMNPIPVNSLPLPLESTSPNFAPKSNYIPSVPSLSESKSTLSFAGLHGLIQKSAFEKTISSEKTQCKDVNSKIATDCIFSQNSVPKLGIKVDSECKAPPVLLRSEKVLPVFGASGILNKIPIPEPVKSEENSSSKDATSIFGCLVKPEIGKEINKDSKHIEPNEKNSNRDSDDKMPDIKTDEMHSLKSPECKGKQSDVKTFKHSIISPAKFCSVTSENNENKLKDNFDLLVQGSGSFSQEAKKVPEIKDNIFSLSFTHSTPKEKFLLQQPYNKLLALSAENLYRIKPKPSETVDLSKTIPGILERLKKDVVTESKITDSPPPQKEELNFDFLRGSQDVGKSLSRSDSSNSLRICEDMSDTNDSNIDTKDLTIGEKIDVPSIFPTTSNSNNMPSISENITEKCSNTASSFNSPTNVSNNIEKKEESKSSQKTSVITASVLPFDSASASSPAKLEIDVKISTLEEFSVASDKDINSKTEPAVLKTDEIITPKKDCKLDSEPTGSEYSTAPVDNKSVEVHSAKDLNNSSSDINTSTENKDSLFDDLLKIKCTNNNFNQSSVIMRTPETKVISTVEPEVPVMDKEEKEISVEEVVHPVKESNIHAIAALEESSTPKNLPLSENDNFGRLKEEPVDTSLLSENKITADDNINPEEDGSFLLLSKKEGKKKKLGKKLGKKFGNNECFEKEEKDSKIKEGKSKSKKRAKLENDEVEKSKDSDLKSKSKKIKKNKNKKRFLKHDDQLGEHCKKTDFKEDDHKDIASDKIKRKEKRKSDKKFLKCGMKSDDFADPKTELTKKKKGKKNRDKLGNEKKDFSEKKTKKKRKLHVEDNQDTDSEKDSVSKIMDKKKKKDRKKFKAKDCSSSDDATEKFFKDQSVDLNLPSGSEILLRQDSKNDDPDMSFLLCEEKVPASPVGIGNAADDTSGSSSIEGSRVNSEMERLPLPNVYPSMDNIESVDTLNKHSIDTSAVLDNTPPTTPSSTESLLSSSPSHERDSFSMNYPESTQSGRDSGEGESDIFRCNSNRTVMRGSEEYRAAATLAFAVCKSVSEKPKEDVSHSFLKRQKSETDEPSPSKRKKKSKRIRRISESAKSPRHKSSIPRMSKIESCCEDSSGASPATSNSPPYGNTSTLSFTRCSPHRLSSVSDSLARYNFYVPLHDKDPEKRIAVIQEKMAELRKEYMALRAEVIAIDHKRRRARKKVREAAGAATTNVSVQSEDGQSCS